MAEPLVMTTEITIPAAGANLAGALSLPERAHTAVLFVHGSGSSRHSPRNQFVARTLNNAGLATLLFDLPTPNEERIDSYTAEFRFNIELLAERLSHATTWTRAQANTRDLGIGYFGSSTGAAAALVAAAEFPDVEAVVSRGGRPDLAGDALPKVRAPTLLIVGGKDEVVITLNEQAQREMRAEVKLEIVPGAAHLFEEPGALNRVAELATDWFLRHSDAAKSARQPTGAKPSSPPHA
jgi:putative phosphoribosyl transferase